MTHNVVISDLHGEKFALEQLEKQFTGEDYRIIFLGDACDRGMYPYELMKDMLQLANDGKAIYLKGNHEAMFVKAARALKHYQIENQIERLTYDDLMILESIDNDIALSFFNGGHNTMGQWMRDGMSMDIVNKIDKLPVKFSYNEFDMCHAGCLPEQWDADNEYEMIWNRNHFMAPWKDGRILVHGHTPINILYDEYLSFFGKNNSMNSAYSTSEPIEFTRIYGASKYNEDKMDLDFGTFYTGVSCAYDLDEHRLILLTE